MRWLKKTIRIKRFHQGDDSMKKVIIVDDEMLVRVGLRTSINWEELGFVVEGEARNGIEAIDKFSDSGIDLLITDIAMPEMDGLELSKHFLNINKDIQIIILTHHENFAYAKKAIDIGVNHYILKSDLDSDIFIEILKKISDKISQVVQIDYKERYKKNEALLKRCLGEKILPSEKLQFNYEGYYLCRFKLCTTISGGKDKKAVNAIITSTLQGIKNEYYYLEDAEMDKKILVFDAESSDFKKIVMAMGDLKDNLENILSREVKYDYAIKHKKVEELYPQLLKSGNTNAKYMQHDQYPFYVRKAFEFINKNYQKNISLSDVASHCDLNASYLSNLIRKETGITYSKYLNLLRIEEAKYLLETTNMKVYEVSVCVGIDNQYYFGKLFKDITGLTCSEYRKRTFEKGQ